MGEGWREGERGMRWGGGEVMGEVMEEEREGEMRRWGCGDEGMCVGGVLANGVSRRWFVGQAA